MPGRIAEVKCDNTNCNAQFELWDGVGMDDFQEMIENKDPQKRFGFSQRVCLHCQSVQSLSGNQTKCEVCSQETIEWKGIMNDEIATGPCPKCAGTLEEIPGMIGLWD